MKIKLSENADVINVVSFVLVGIVNTGFSYAIYSALLFVGIGYQLANFMALVVGVLFSFKMQGRLVFKNTDNRLFGRFVISWAFIYVCNIIVIGKIIDLGFDPYVAGALSLPFSVGLSYLTQKFFVFRHSAIDKSEPDHV